MPWIWAPVLAPELLVLLPEILAATVLLALLLTLAIWLEPIIAGARTRHGGLFLRIIDIPGSALRRAAASAYRSVAHSISVAAFHRMRPLAHWFHAAGTVVLATAVTVGDFAGDVARGFEHTIDVVIPREIGRATRPIRHRADRALARAAAAAAAIAALRHWARHVIGHEVRPAIRWLHRAVAVTIPRELGRIRHRVGELEDDLTHPGTRWLRRIAAAMWVTTLLGLMLRTLARRFPWLFCRKVKSVGNRVCGLDPSLLDALLLDTLAISGLVSLVQMTHELQEITEPAVEIMRAAIEEF